LGKIDRLIRRLLPREDKFLLLFQKHAENLSTACVEIEKLFDATTEEARIKQVKVVEDLEHRGDEVTHEIFRELSLTFITPLDREDIAGLASALDNIMDNIDQAATLILLYQITDFDEAMRDLLDIIARSIRELNRAIPMLKDLRDSEAIREACVRVNLYENQADQVFHRALGRLFQNEKDAIRLIKRRELLAALESATDRCEDAAVMIENVLVKYA
jgi:predicted phosphate transport protein (TIGR00153 family)